MVICRRNAPVLSMTYKLALAGIPATMRGRDIGKGMMSLVARLKPDNTTDLISKVERFRMQETARLRHQEASPSAFESLNDRCDCLGQLAAQVDTLGSLEAFIGRVFDDDATPDRQVVLSSVHRSKGLEAGTVYILDPATLPLIRRDSQDWQKQQERNICYIACTRSKHTLVFEDEIPLIFRR